MSFEYIENIVKNNDKKRYQLQKELDGWYIRAVQGHTLEVTDLELVQIQYPTEVPMAIHGTTLEAYDKISKFSFFFFFYIIHLIIFFSRG